jgi:hypothetical protein
VIGVPHVAALTDNIEFSREVAKDGGEVWRSDDPTSGKEGEPVEPDSRKA